MDQEQFDYFWEVFKDPDLEGTDEHWIASQELTTALALAFGLPAPWADPDKPPAEVIEFERLVAETEGRPHLATEMILLRLGPDITAGRRVRNANPAGRPPKSRPTAEELWIEVQGERERVTREVSVTEGCRVVARRHCLTERHVLRLTHPFRTGKVPREESA